MIELSEKSEPVDLVTLTNFLKDREQLENIVERFTSLS